MSKETKKVVKAVPTDTEIASLYEPFDEGSIEGQGREPLVIELTNDGIEYYAYPEPRTSEWSEDVTVGYVSINTKAQDIQVVHKDGRVMNCTGRKHRLYVTFDAKTEQYDVKSSVRLNDVSIGNNTVFCVDANQIFSFTQSGDSYPTKYVRLPDNNLKQLLGRWLRAKELGVLKVDNRKPKAKKETTDSPSANPQPNMVNESPKATQPKSDRETSG